MIFSLVRIFSYVLFLCGLSFALPLGVAIYHGEHSATASFAVPMAASVAAAAAMAISSRRFNAPPLGIRSAFTAVAGSWIVLGFFGALPLYLSGAVTSITDAVFESFSGFTTTGASVIPNVESLPRSINVWRCETHWLGGMGIIALVVALVPLLGIGGFRLIQAEMTGPEKGKLTNRITNTAKVLWFIYFGFTAVQAALLHWCGLDALDALCHAFSTLGTGGFSTRNSSVGAFGNPAAEWICTVFMLLAAVNFALHYRLFTGRTDEIRRDTELKAYAGIVTVAMTVVCLVLLAGPGNTGDLIRNSAFQVASVISTTGFMTADYAAWHPAAQAVLFALFFVGGCSGSTAGGMKVVRWTILAKQLANEFRRLLHPHGVFSLHLNSMPGRESLVPFAASFLFIYLMLVMLTAFMGALAGLQPFEALTAALSMVGNIGPAFGELGPTSNYALLPTALKWWYVFAMLAGRLEIYTMFILVGSVGALRRSPR